MFHSLFKWNGVQRSQPKICMMFRSVRLQSSSILGTKTGKKRVVIVGLKEDNYSREMLLRLLTSVIAPGDSVRAVHVEEPNDAFDPNTFHIHEDICKSKQVDYHVQLSTGDSFVTVLIHQVRLHHATMLVIGCSRPRPKESVVTSYLKGLPPTCSLLVMGPGGKVLLEKQGTSQQGSVSQTQPSKSCSIFQNSCVEPPEFSLNCPKLGTSTSKSSETKHHGTKENVNNSPWLHEPKLHKQFEKLAILEAKGGSRKFTRQELELATDKFSPRMMISEESDSKVYRADLGSGQDVAVKVLKITEQSGEALLQEVEILSGLNNRYIIRLIGYCYSTDLHAVVHNLLQKSLKQNLIQLRWSERKKVAVGVAKALEYLHYCSPPVIHRDVRSSNIMLSCQSQPQLLNFGAAIVDHQHQTPSTLKKPSYTVGTSAYLAPEYLMFGKVDEKIDVYSYGVVLLELITGKDATKENVAASYETLVFQARSLLGHGLCEHLIDPHLNEDYDMEEMQRMIVAARLCIMHSPSRRPTMKTILQLLEDHDYWLKMERAEFMNDISFKRETMMKKDDLARD